MAEGSPLSRVPKPVRIILVLLVLSALAALVMKVTGQLRADPDGLIRASGTVEVRTVEVASEVAGNVLKRPIEKGDSVDTGDLIAVVASEVITADVDRAQAALETARENLRRAEEAVKLQEGVAERDVERASAALRTAAARSRDVEDGSRPQEIEAARSAVGQAKAAVDAAAARLRQLESGLRPEEIRQAEAAHEAAGANVEAARAKLADLEAGARDQEIGQARAALDKARTARERARKDYDRALALVRQGAMPQQQVDGAEAAYEAAEADVKAAGERLALVQAGARTNQLSAARAQLEQALANQRSAKEALALARKGPRQEDIDQAGAALQQARATQSAAQAQLDLVRSGARRGQRDTARRQVDEARAALNLATENRRQVELRKAESDAARAQVLQAQAAVDAATAALDKYEVLAPAPGIIDDTHVRVGEVVKPGSSLVTLIDFSDTWVTVYVPEPKLPLIKVGDAATITVDGLPGQTLTGTIRRIGSQAEFTPKYVQTQDERARTVFPVEIAVDNSQRLLKPGMPADAVMGNAGS